MTTVRTRFAPSPTGTPESIHLGFVIRALWSYAYAKKNSGQFILRIEDTDQKRSRKDTEEEIYNVLRKFNIEWDEGPDVGGEFGPYRQSERLDKYKEAAKILVEKGYAYYDFDAIQREKDEIKASYSDEEKKIEEVIKNLTNISAKAGLEGEHLNTSYGYIGAEQHLKRYPGDILENHGPYYKEGIAPGLGAWGYFAKSKADLTLELVEIEKWYAVVQTLYLPDWSSRQPYLRNWYKYRKVMIVNTKNGNAVISAIADAGPAAFTGKHFGGSPEVMEYLGGSRYKKGAVLLFFVDDPENKVKLGPVDYNDIGVPPENLIQI